jgi:hypothetical protein
MDKTKNEEATVTIPASEYIKLIAFRLKDVKPLFPEKSRMARIFADSIKPGSLKWK